MIIFVCKIQTQTKLKKKKIMHHACGYQRQRIGRRKYRVQVGEKYKCPGIRRACSVAKLCPILFDAMDCSPPGCSVHGILQAKILEWIAIPFSREDLWYPLVSVVLL